MSKRVKSLDEIRESRILFDKNPPAFGYILITVVAVFLIVAVVWSIKTPKVYTIQAQGTVTNDESNYVMCSYTGEILDSNMEEGALVEAGMCFLQLKALIMICSRHSLKTTENHMKNRYHSIVFL